MPIYIYLSIPTLFTSHIYSPVKLTDVYARWMMGRASMFIKPPLILSRKAKQCQPNNGLVFCSRGCPVRGARHYNLAWIQKTSHYFAGQATLLVIGSKCVTSGVQFIGSRCHLAVIKWLIGPSCDWLVIDWQVFKKGKRWALWVSCTREPFVSIMLHVLFQSYI